MYSIATKINFMKETTRAFLKLFFNKDEEICFSANKYAYPSEPQDNILEDTTVLVAVNPIKGQRNDKNVTSYRTFMVECDDISLEEQMKYIKESEFPFSYCCFSGGRSYHFALVLDRDIPSEHIYRHTYQWILNILEKADQKTKNPSRSIRFPGSIRPDTGQEQKLIYMGERISYDDLARWLNKHEDKKPAYLKRKNPGRSSYANLKTIKPWVGAILKKGVHNKEGSRNQTWMAIGCELALNGFDLENTISFLQGYFEEQSDFREREWLSAVTSGWKYADKLNEE